nr:MAG TPA: hypothetical protein [Caudoviricetes sp.]
MRQQKNLRDAFVCICVAFACDLFSVFCILYLTYTVLQYII